MDRRTRPIRAILTTQGERIVIFAFEERPSDSPWVERVWRTRAERPGSFSSIAASRWEMVVSRYRGETTITVRGPETIATPATCLWTGAEFFGIVYRLGTFMPNLPPGQVMDRRDVTLPDAAGQSFWLHGSAWRYPNYDNADTFVARLARDGLIAHDPVVQEALHGHLNDVSVRTAQRRVLRATGLTPSTIRQIDRARHAASLLQQGASIFDAVFEAGYFDQAHLTRSLRRFIGQTPSQILDKDRAEQTSLLYQAATPWQLRDPQFADQEIALGAAV
jgi:AraC-like DNA-binding protein